MTQYMQRDTPGSFTEPPPTLIERACRPIPATLIAIAFGIAAWCVLAAVIVYAPAGRF